MHRSRHFDAVRLSKSRFTYGTQCVRQLWWRARDATAPESVPDEALLRKYALGHEVGELARTHTGAGVLVIAPHGECGYDDRLALTAKAVRDGAALLYEAAFLQDAVFVAVDILQRTSLGWVLTEVKSTTSVKPQHIDDAAIQAHVVERAGLPIARVEIMHLNPAARTRNLADLFVRADVTHAVAERRVGIDAEIRRQLDVLQGPIPEVAPGPHCRSPYPCPFLARCTPPQPADPTEPDPYRVDAAGLREALAPFALPLGFLDFETINPAIPLWDDCAPYEAIPLQFSAHVEVAVGHAHAHHEWLAPDGSDPRRPLAVALLDACAGARTVLAYNASFERNIILRLAEHLPDLAEPLLALADRTVDLLAVVRAHVKHPGFGGSYGLKRVLPVLTDVAYDDLPIANGFDATTALARIAAGQGDPATREALLAYCRRDTWGLVRLLESLRALT